MINNICLTEDERQYIIGGKHYSRISDIAGAGDKSFLKKWREKVGEVEADRITKEAGDYGTMVHEITMWSDMKKPKKVEAILKKNEFLFPTLLSWDEWVRQYIKEWIAIEQIVWSNKLRCAGRIDRVGIMVGDKSPSIIDLKTGGMWDTIGVQLAGYLVLYNEKAKKKAHRRLAISLPRKEPGKLSVKEFTEEKFVEEFKYKAELFRSMNQ